MNFAKIEVFFRFSRFSSLLRLIMPAAFDRAGGPQSGKFYTENVFLDIFLELLGLVAPKINKRVKNQAKTVKTSNIH